MRYRPLRAVDAGFLANAPRLITSTGVVDAPREKVFAALSGDPATWTWFPGFSDQGRWLTGPPHGAGSRREVHMGRAGYRETVLVWEEPERWAFRVDETTSPPVLRALAEEYRLVANGSQTVVHWTFCAEGPPLVNALLGSPLSRPALGLLWRRACANLGSRLQG